MKTSHSFTPALADTLETRSVPSTMHPFIMTQGALSGAASVVVHPPGTFSNGLPTVHVATDGERFTLGRVIAPTTIAPVKVVPHVTTSPTTTAVTPAAVVVHPPGTFSNGYPTVHVASDGERFTLGRFGR